MKATHTILPAPFTIALLLACACAENRAPVTTPGRPAPSPLSVLQRQDRKTVWNEPSQVIADLNQDGVDDYALRGRRKDRVVVGIVAGPLTAKSRAWVLAFPWGKGTQGSLCSQEAKIEAEDLSDAAMKKPRKGKGISLYDDRCDSFHIYWSPEGRKFDWWRL